MQNLGQHGELFDIRLDISEMVRLYCLSVLREDGDYGGVSFPSRGTCRLHECVQQLFPRLASQALDIMSLRTVPADLDTVLREIVCAWHSLSGAPAE